MKNSVFIELDFALLLIFSLVLPVAIYVYLMWRNALSRGSVLLFAIILIIVSGIDVFLLQRLAVRAKLSPALYDDLIFSSELSVALYLLPALFAGVGVNMISHELINHLRIAERRARRKS